MTDNTKAFFELMRAGLWEKEARLSAFRDYDYASIYRLAEEQCVVGLVAAGLDHLQDVPSPREAVMPFVNYALRQENKNKAMNLFIEGLVQGMAEAGIRALLVKGQGIARCYERPLWRACGDVDLLLDYDNYINARSYLTPRADSVGEEDKNRLHLDMVLDSWVVELHGTLHSRQLPRLNKVVDEVQEAIFQKDRVRVWRNGDTDVFLPAAGEDIILVFSHILQHFFGGGVGLRQICDWCRLLWTYRETIDVELLKNRLSRAGVMTEWKAFAALAVEWLGMPMEAMPLYVASHKWSRKAKRIVAFILKNGNFGRNRDNSFRKKSKSVQRMVSLWRYLCDTKDHFFVFPLDSLKVMHRMVWGGLRNAV